MHCSLGDCSSLHGIFLIRSLSSRVEELIFPLFLKKRIRDVQARSLHVPKSRLCAEKNTRKSLFVLLAPGRCYLNGISFYTYMYILSEYISKEIIRESITSGSSPCM